MPRQHNNITVYRKRKLVLQESESAFPLPDDKLKIFKLGKSVGSNLYQAFFPTGDETLLSMPTKFRDTIYVSYGMFAMAFEILENDKIWGEIQYILFPHQIKNIQENKLWPQEFGDDNQKKLDENYISEDLLPNISDSESEIETDSENDDDDSTESDGDDACVKD